MKRSMHTFLFCLPKRSLFLIIAVIGLGTSFAGPSFAQRDSFETAQAAFAAKDRKQFPLAIRLFDEALQQGHFENKQRGFILYGRGASYEALGSRDRALADFDAAVALIPDYPNVYLYRGIILGDKGEYERALQDFQTAGRLNPNEPLAFNNLGNVHERMGDVDRAIENYSRAIDLRAGYAQAYYNRAHAYFLIQDNERALADYSQSILLQPRFGDAYVNRAVLYLMRRDFTSSLADLDTAISLNPRDVTALANRATVYLALEKYESAVSDFDRALEVSPGNAALYLGRGQANLFAGAVDISISDFGTAMRVHPSGYPAIWLHIARVHKGEDDGEEFAVNIKNIRRDVWPSPLLDLYLGAANRESVLAAAQSGRITEKIRRSCEARFFIGEFELHKGEIQRARETLWDVVSTCGPQEGVYGAAVAERKLLPKP
jgi:lipoprotein NlpI